MLSDHSTQKNFSINFSERNAISSSTTIGPDAQSTRWDLSGFYSSLDDPRFSEDLNRFTELAISFSSNFRGQLTAKLGPAIEACKELNALAEKPAMFLFLQLSLNTGDATIKKLFAEVQERVAMVSGQYLTFFELEIAALAESDILRQETENATVKKHRPLINKIRLFKKHLLSEEIEQALVKRSPFGSVSWAQFFDEVEADLRVKLDGQEITLTAVFHFLEEEKDAARRANILAAVHQALGGFFLKYSAETLMNVVREKSVEDTERHYPHSMSARNLSNQLPDAVVEALHQAVLHAAAPIMRRHYQLKAAHLGLSRLAWSDRNAPLPFHDGTIIPFTEAKQIVLTAYEKFSPTLAALVKQQFDEKRVDAPHLIGKRSGAFNCSFCLPGDQPVSFTFLNYLGTARDVATLAHELGHGVHGLVAGETQGALMMHAPMAYAETASIFGEMITFNHLMETFTGEKKFTAALDLLMSKSDDFANSVVRQISFSEFERRVHGAGHRLSTDDLSQLWIQTTQELYGADGDIFTYQNFDRLWAYISHFHNPFYVYAYATGEIFTQSLFARRDDYGADFEPLYLDLLRAGMTKSAVELLKPFGLDPTDPSFWQAGIENSFGIWVQKAVELSAAQGIKVE